MEIDPRKTGMRNKEFKFLGVVIDLERETMTYEGSTISVHDKEFAT